VRAGWRPTLDSLLKLLVLRAAEVSSVSDINPVQARVVRDATLKSITGAQEELEAWANSADHKKPTPTKAVPYYTDLIYREMRNLNIAICKVIIRLRRHKKNMGLIVEWEESDGQLYGVANKITGHPTPDITFLFEVSVRRHALERVSERLGTLDTLKVRNELSAAVSSILLEIATISQLNDGEYYARTPHGLAMLIIEDEEPVITTWIPNELTRPEQIGGQWIHYVGERGVVSIETATGHPVYKLREQ
jgi:hypothetical protein